ncbi:MAG TPA: hypothetical protein VJP78_13125 [Thermoleophilia bacterium]|nr:hypothetical protein [Thermoleophilia bacterium]
MAGRGEVERAVGSQTDRDQQYVNLVVSSFEQSRDYYAQWFKDADYRYRLYRGFRQGRTIPFRNNITIPLAFSMIQSGIARKLEFAAGGPPIEFQAGGPEDQMIARKQTSIINTQFEDAGFLDKETRTLASGEIYGIALSRYFWDVAKELVQYRADLGTGIQEFSGEDVTFDGPNYEPMNVRNCFPQPGVPRIAQMRWFVDRYFLDLEDINRLAEANFFLKRGARMVADSPVARGAHKDAILTTHLDPASGLPEDAIRTTAYEKPIEILRFFGRAPRSMAQEGQVNLVVEVAARMHLLRARPNPYGRIPILEDGPMPDPDHFHRPSKLEVIEKIAVASNALASQKMDAVNLTVDPQYVYNARVTTRPARLWSRPGAVHRWEGPVDDANFRPLVPDLRGLVNAYQELEQHAQWMEQGTGVIRDAIQGFSGPDRETARGYLGRQASANIRLTMEMRIHEHLHTEPLANAFLSLNRRFLEFPQQLRMIGASAIVDPITLQPIPSYDAEFGPNDLLPDYAARATGTLRMLGRQTQLQNMLLIQQAAQSNPIGLQLTNWFFFFRQLYTLAGIPNPDELLNTSPLLQQLMAQQGQAQQPPGQPAQENALPVLGETA